MKTICTVCGMGLGSSLIIEINIKKVLEQLGKNLDDFEITHKNLNSYSPSDNYDIVVCGSDLEDLVQVNSGTKIVLNNLMDIEALKNKLIKEI